MKPFIVCHMMASLDGRIDCDMLEKYPGGDCYYDTLDSYNVRHSSKAASAGRSIRLCRRSSRHQIKRRAAFLFIVP